MANGNNKTVTIKIDGSDLENLKEEGYKICFAKKVNDGYNVVWQSESGYYASNTFSWKPLYQLFGSDEFEGDVTVSVSTNVVDIGLGEQATLDAAGVLGEASTGGPSTAVTMVNEAGRIHPALNSYSIYNGQAVTSAIYVAPQAIEKGPDSLTPVETVQVWFEQKIESSTMFSDARTNVTEIDLTDQNSATRLYSNGEWSTPELGMDMGMDMDAVDAGAILTIIALLTAAVSIVDLTTKISSKLTGVYRNVTVKVTTMSGNTVKVQYQERSGLTGTALKHTRTLLQDGATVDQLTQFTTEGFAQLGVGYQALQAY